MDTHQPQLEAGVSSSSSLYADVLRYQKKAATLASAFIPTVSAVEKREGGGMPLYEVGVVDVIVRYPTVLGSIPAIPYIEYQVALTRRTDQKTAILGKRYSELLYFNDELHRRDIIRKLDAPSFPEKKLFCEEWWTLRTLEPSSKFVKERREEIHYYLKKLFIANPTIFTDLFVEDFFNLRCFDQIATSQHYLLDKLLSADAAANYRTHIGDDSTEANDSNNNNTGAVDSAHGSDGNSSAAVGGPAAGSGEPRGGYPDASSSAHFLPPAGQYPGYSNSSSSNLVDV